MRIRRAARIVPRPGRRGRPRYRKIAARAWLWAGLLLAFGVAMAIWYQFEGYGLVDPWLRDRILAGRGAKNALPTLRLDVKRRDIRELAVQRDEALRAGT